jgi:hypothetical protein
LGEEMKNAKAAAQTLKTAVAKAELRLAGIERWVKYASMAGALIAAYGAVVAAYVAFSQRKLLEAQSLEQMEKQRVSYKLRLSPVLLPNHKSFYVRATMRNLSVRRLTVMMIGVRVWQGDKWQYDRSVKDNLSELIVSDNLVSEVPDKWTQNEDRLKLHRLGEEITLEPTELDSDETFGPYSIEESQVERGFWVMGRLYVEETERGKCGIDPARQPDRGTLPHVCELNSKGSPDCTKTECSVVISPATYYFPKRINGLVSLEEK